MKKLILTGVILAVIGVGVGFYLYNKPHKSLLSQASAYTISADELLQAYVLDESDSNEKYLDQIIEVEGKILRIEIEGETINVVLDTSDEMSAVICQMESGKYKKPDFKVGQAIILKGICTGMLMDVVLVQCVKSE